MLDALRFALTSWRTASVSLLYFSSGLPLGLVWIAIPDWMRDSGHDIRLVGLTTLLQAPWTFKILWSPLMDRYPLPWLGRRRGWMAVTQIALFATTLLLAGAGHNPETLWVVGALALTIAIASASQDIVLDAYTVDVLRPEEYGVVVGVRTAVYRGAMFVAGGLAITLAGRFSWPAVNAMLAALYLPMLLVTRLAPNPEECIPTPSTLVDAIWKPFLGMLSRHRAVEILAFVVLYKLTDNLAQSLLRPFLGDMGYSSFDRGVALATVGLAATLVGTFLGGALTTVIGLGHSLWIFGLLQIFSNIGYILVAQSGVNRPLMYGAMTFETLTTGLGMGAFGVLLLRLTQKRFSATQYALFSSLFALPRIVAGPVTGVFVHATGWSTFFWFTMAAGIPGLVLLARFVPPGTREPNFTVEPPRFTTPLPHGALVLRAAVGGVLAGGTALLSIALLEALEAMQAGEAFEVVPPLVAMFPPQGLDEGLYLAGAIVIALAGALAVAAVAAARHGMGESSD